MRNLRIINTNIICVSDGKGCRENWEHWDSPFFPKAVLSWKNGRKWMME